jgi:hypothetical protein
MGWFDKIRRKTVEDAIDDAQEVIEEKVKESVDILPALLTIGAGALIFFSTLPSAGSSKTGLTIKVDNVNLYL